MRNLRERNHLENLGVDDGMILKCPIDTSFITHHTRTGLRLNPRIADETPATNCPSFNTAVSPTFRNFIRFLSLGLRI